MNIFLTESLVEDPKLMVGADFLVEKTCLPEELPIVYCPACALQSLGTRSGLGCLCSSTVSKCLERGQRAGAVAEGRGQGQWQRAGQLQRAGALAEGRANGRGQGNSQGNRVDGQGQGQKAKPEAMAEGRMQTAKC